MTSPPFVVAVHIVLVDSLVVVGSRWVVVGSRRVVVGSRRFAVGSRHAAEEHLGAGIRAGKAEAVRNLVFLTYSFSLLVNKNTKTIHKLLMPHAYKSLYPEEALQC